jgi:WD40 repeat protein
MCSEKNFYLCKYHIDRNKNDLQRYVNNSMCKLVQKFELTFAQNISTMFTINSFYSCKQKKFKTFFSVKLFLVFCGGTDKSLEVFDLNQCKSSLAIHEIHSRPFHQICLNKSEFNQVSYDIFLTNAIGDGIKLWDLRNAQ